MNEAQQMLEDSVSRLFSDLVTRDTLTRLEATTWDDALWNATLELGLPLVMVDEARNGMGAGWNEAFLVARACGRHALPLPVPEQMLAGWLLDQAGLDQRPGVIGLLPAAVPATALNGDVISGSFERVPWGRHADVFVGIGERGELLLIPAAGADVHAGTNLAREPRDTVSFSRAKVLARAPTSLPADAIRCLGALLRSAQIAGAAQACLELSVRYTSEREQFGRALAQFQAIQHHLAELAGELSSVDTMAQVAHAAMAARGLHGDGDARFEIAAAKCRASEAVEALTRLNHQVHGAIGFTYEYDLQFLTRRLWSWRAEFGAHGEWGELLGRIAMARGGDRLWELLTA